MGKKSYKQLGILVPHPGLSLPGSLTLCSHRSCAWQSYSPGAGLKAIVVRKLCNRHVTLVHLSKANTLDPFMFSTAILHISLLIIRSTLVMSRICDGS